jgi:hypothetical protein
MNVHTSGAAFTKCFHNSSTIFLRFFYDYSLRAYTVFSAQKPSQPQQGKSFPEFGMHQNLLQFFPARANGGAGKNCRKILRALVRRGRIVEKLKKYFARAPLENISTIFLQFFHNSFLPPLPVEGPQNLSTILLQFFLVWKNLVHPDWLGEEL